MRRDKARDSGPDLRVGSAPEENVDNNKIVARLYIPKNYDKLDEKTRKEFDEIKRILERAPKEWYSVHVLKEHAEGDLEDTVLFFGSMRCYDIETTLKYLKVLAQMPSYNLRT